MKIKDNENTLDISQVTWGEINKIMMGLYSAKRIFEHRFANNKADINAETNLKDINRLIDDINQQYPNWKGKAISLLDNNLAETLTKSGIYNNNISII